MKKEKVYIVLSIKHVLKTPGKKDISPQWDRVENVEFVSQIRHRHVTTSVAIGDYINRKMEKGNAYGLGDYATFEKYIRSKYEKEMKQLDDAFEKDRIPAEDDNREVITDEFGNLRVKTVFDKASV